MHDLEQQLKAYYGAKRMPEEIATAILLEARQMRPLRFRLPWRRALSAAAVLAVLATGAVLTLVRVSPQRIAATLADEIAVHHLAGDKPAVLTDNYQYLQSQLDRLTFSILPARPRLLQQYALVGGKYCSLQGNLAALLKLTGRRHGEMHTLYVTPLTLALRRVKPETFYRDGVIVELWSDGERFFGLASDATEDQP